MLWVCEHWLPLWKIKGTRAHSSACHLWHRNVFDLSKLSITVLLVGSNRAILFTFEIEAADMQTCSTPIYAYDCHLWDHRCNDGWKGMTVPWSANEGPVCWGQMPRSKIQKGKQRTLVKQDTCYNPDKEEGGKENKNKLRVKKRKWRTKVNEVRKHKSMNELKLGEAQDTKSN